MTIEMEDVDGLLAEVAIFARERIAPGSERPEIPVSLDVLLALSNEASEMGLLPLGQEEPGFSLWEDVTGSGAMAFNMGLLRHVGRANAGLAFAWHRYALARHVMSALGIRAEKATVLDTTLLSTGHYGLAQASLGQYLAGECSGEDKPKLQDWLDRQSKPGVLTAVPVWQSVLWPVWQEGRIGWQLAPRSRMQVETLSSQHGFDDLSSFRIQLEPMADVPVHVVPRDDGMFYARVLMLDMLGLLAIGAGALARAQDMTVDFTSVRRQGGKVIAGHAAVQQMLGELEMAVQQADAGIQRLSRPLDRLSMREVASARATTHALLCHAANQAVQAHGGLGYMRDLGAEKIVRDQNMLKLQAGGTRELPLLLAGLGEVQA